MYKYIYKYMHKYIYKYICVNICTYIYSANAKKVSARHHSLLVSEGEKEVSLQEIRSWIEFVPGYLA